MRSERKFYFRSEDQELEVIILEVQNDYVNFFRFMQQVWYSVGVYIQCSQHVIS